MIKPNNSRIMPGMNKAAKAMGTGISQPPKIGKSKKSMKTAPKKKKGAQ